MSHQVRLDNDVYEYIKDKKRDDETFSEAIDRLTTEWSLDDFAASDPIVDPEAHRKLLEQTDEQSIEDTTELLETMGIGLEAEEQT